MSEEVVGVQFDRLLELLSRFGLPSVIEEQQSQVVVHLAIKGGEPHSLAILSLGFHRASLLEQDVAEVEMGVGKVRIGAQGFSEVCETLVDAPRFSKQQADVIVRPKVIGVEAHSGEELVQSLLVPTLAQEGSP